MEGDGGLATGIPARLTSAEGRKFAWTVGAAFLVLGGIVWWREHYRVATVLLSLGGILAVAGLILPGHLTGVYRAWMGLAHAISRVTTPIFMGIVYFVVLAPIGMLMRAFGKNPLAPPKTDTVWHEREPQHRRSDLSRQF
jgi:hypothetical protein